MTTAQIILSIIYFIVAIVLTAVVIMQTGKSSGLGAIAGGNGDSFLAKNKSKSLDARMAKMTKWIAIAFMVLSLVICFLPAK